MTKHRRIVLADLIRSSPGDLYCKGQDHVAARWLVQQRLAVYIGAAVFVGGYYCVPAEYMSAATAALYGWSK